MTAVSKDTVLSVNHKNSIKAENISKTSKKGHPTLSTGLKENNTYL